MTAPDIAARPLISIEYGGIRTRFGRWPKFLVLVLALVLVSLPDDSDGAAAHTLPYVSSQQTIGWIGLASAGLDAPVHGLSRAAAEENAPCVEHALCWDPATGTPGDATNAVYYRWTANPGQSPFFDLSPGLHLRVALKEGNDLDYMVVRSEELPVEDPRLRGYRARTTGDVITIIECPVGDGSVIESCAVAGGSVFVVRAESTQSLPTLKTVSIGSPPGSSWESVSVKLPGLLIGHLVFTGGLMFLLWLSWGTSRQQSHRNARSAPDLFTVLLGGWLLLGLALTELGSNYSDYGQAEFDSTEWVLGGAVFTGALLISSQLLHLFQLESGRHLLRLAGVLTSLGLIAIYYWEANSGAGHSLFFKQLTACSVSVLVCPLAARTVASGRLQTALGSPSVVRAGSLALAGFASLCWLAYLDAGTPSISLPVAGNVLLSPALEISILVGVVASILQARRTHNRRDSILVWSGPLVALAVLLFMDLGLGVILASTCLLVVAAAGVPLKRIAVLAGPLVIIGIAVLITYPGTSRGETRLESWFDPSGFYRQTEQENLVSRAFRETLEGRLEGLTPAALATPSGNATITAEVMSDIDKLELEFSYRLHKMRTGDAQVAATFLPEEDAGDDRLLLIHEELWAGLGGYDLGNRPTAKGAFVRRIDGAVARMREFASSLGWQGNFPPPGPSGPDAIRASYFDVAQPAADNFQQRQSLTSLRSGRLLGSGWGLGNPQDLPVATEDMTVGLIGETLGFLGLASLVLIAFRIAWNGLRQPWRGEDVAAALLRSSIGVLFGVHCFVALGGALNLVPLTGVPLPFSGRSGAFILMEWMAIGLIVGAVVAGKKAQVDRQEGCFLLLPHLRTACNVLALSVVATLFIVQVAGYSFSPAGLLLRVPSTSQPYTNEDRGSVVDRTGRVLVAEDSAAGAQYPDPKLARSLSHSLAGLTNGSEGTLTPSVHPVASFLGGAFWERALAPQLLTTIDSGTQRAVHDAFENQLLAAGRDSRAARGAAVVLDVSTGEILASESRPTFDPRAISDKQAWAADEANARRSGSDDRLLNRAVLGKYSPGSTFKVVTLAAALESGLYPPETVIFNYHSGDPANNFHRLDIADGPPVVDSNHPHPGSWSFTPKDALVWSDNVAFAEMAITLGPEAIISESRRFGFERPIDIEGLGSSLSTVDSGYADAPSNRSIRTTQANLAHTGYGQGEISTSPLQMAMVAAAVANDGIVMEPFLVKAWQNPENGPAEMRSPRPIGRAMSSEVAKEMQDILWSSVRDGWARDARVNFANTAPGVAGKTGTAEWSDEGRNPHSWFIGYFPAERPRVAVAVVVEEGGDAHIASLIARDIFAAQAVGSYVQNSSSLPAVRSSSTAVAAMSEPPRVQEHEPLTLERIFGPMERSPIGLDPARLRTIIATGDVIPARKVDATIREHGNDFLYPVARTAELTAAGDLTVVNLEAPLIGGCPASDSGLTFCGQRGFVQALQAAGVDVVTLENNHIDNYGALGRAETEDALRAAGITFADRNLPVVTDVRGLRFGFLAFNGVGPGFDRQHIRTQIRTLRPQVDVLVVAFQWGAEYVPLPEAAPGIADDDPVQIAHLAVDSGADLILGNHPHRVQPVEVYRDKLITYAHGNFIFDQMWSYETRVGVVGRYTFYDDVLVDVQFVPTLIEEYAQPRLMEGEEAEAVLDAMKAASLELAAKRAATEVKARSQ